MTIEDIGKNIALLHEAIFKTSYLVAVLVQMEIRRGKWSDKDLEDLARDVRKQAETRLQEGPIDGSR